MNFHFALDIKGKYTRKKANIFCIFIFHVSILTQCVSFPVPAAAPAQKHSEKSFITHSKASQEREYRIISSTFKRRSLTWPLFCDKQYHAKRKGDDLEC